MKNKPLILGHRGYRAKFPENTILSFAGAFEHGADGIECDIQKTADKRYIVFHDDELSRVTGRRGYVKDMNFSELSGLDAGSGEKIPDINSFLNSLRGHRLRNIELKVETITGDDFSPLDQVISHSGFKKDVIISSFNHDLLPAYRSAGYRIGLLFDEESLKNGMFSAFLKVLKYRPFSVNLPVETFSGKVSASAKRFLRAVRLLGVKTVYWTVNIEEQYNAVKHNAFAVITDNVELMVSLRDRELITL